jgi:hypothetical protein
LNHIIFINIIKLNFKYINICINHYHYLQVNKEALLSSGLGEKDSTIASPKKSSVKKKLSIQKERLEIKLTVLEMRGTYLVDCYLFLYLLS